MQRHLLRVFEYETLRYPSERNGVAFTEEQFNALVLFNERHQNQYFTVVHQGIRFSHYVGVIQTGNLTIEILPKADQDEPTDENRMRWQSILLDMLRECSLLKAEPPCLASVQLRTGSLLDIYLEAFLAEIEMLLRRGLLAQYRRTEGNLSTLKGSLHFNRHIQHNTVHQERFYVRHQTYDNRLLLHQVLYQALLLLPKLTNNALTLKQARRLTLLFPAQPDWVVTETTFEAIRLDRKTQLYQTALSLARLLLLHYQPDVRGGTHHTLAILFDMNVLFEEYIYRQLKKAESDTVLIERQVPTDFWAHKRVKPDILIRQLDTRMNYIVDTKWKMLRHSQPDEDDLKQMYVYNQYYCAAKSILLYPHVSEAKTMYGVFHQPNPFLSHDPTKQAHGCEVRFVQLVEAGRLRKGLGDFLLNSILSLPTHQPLN